jgi:hypothetical protein
MTYNVATNVERTWVQVRNIGSLGRRWCAGLLWAAHGIRNWCWHG